MLTGPVVVVVGPDTVERAAGNVELARQCPPRSERQRALLPERGEQLAETLGPRYGPVS